MQFIFYGIFSALVIGFANALSKKPGAEIGVEKFLFFRTILTTLLLLVVLLFFGGKFNLPMILFSLLISSIAYLAMLSMYKGFTVDKIGLVSPIASTFSMITIILSAIFFHATLEPIQVLSIVIIIIGVIMINLNMNDKLNVKAIIKSNRGVFFGLITAFAYGIFFFLAQIPTRVLGQYETAFLFEVGILICSAVVLFFSKKLKTLKLPDGQTKYDIFLVAIFSVTAILSFYTGLKNINHASIVVALNSASPLVVIVLGRVIYKEKLTTLQKISGVIIVVGIIVLSLTS